MLNKDRLTVEFSGKFDVNNFKPSGFNTTDLSDGDSHAPTQQTQSNFLSPSVRC